MLGRSVPPAQGQSPLVRGLSTFSPPFSLTSCVRPPRSIMTCAYVVIQLLKLSPGDPPYLALLRDRHARCAYKAKLIFLFFFLFFSFETRLSSPVFELVS